jgi:hypothetical protein
MRNLPAALLASNLTDESLFTVCKEVLEQIGFDAAFVEDVPVHSAELMPIQDLASEVSAFLEKIPPVSDIDEVDRDLSADAVSYLLDVFNNLHCDDADIVELARLLEKLAMIQPTFRFQLLHPKEIRVHIHPSGDKELSLGEAIGHIVRKQEEAAIEAGRDDLASKAAAYDSMVRLYREHVHDVLNKRKS